MGLIKGTIKLGVLAGLMALAGYEGYKLHEAKVQNQEFYVDSSRNELVQSKTGRSEPINGNLQVGSVEYRVRGLLEEEPSGLRKAFDYLKK